MQISSNGGADFRALAAKFRNAGARGAAIRKATTAAIQKSLALITDDQKTEIMAWETGGSAGRGTARRQAFTEARARRRFERTGRTSRARKEHSLRSYIRAAIKSRVAYTGRRIGAKVFVDASALPPSQRTLPQHVDSKRGWRHPVWGNRRKWVRQQGIPYFSRPIERHREQVRREVQAAVDHVMRTLQ